MLLERDLIFLGWDWAQRYHGPCPGLVRSQQMEEDGPPRRTDNRPYMVVRSPQADGADKWFDLDTSRARTRSDWTRRRASSTSWGNQAGRRRICLSATHPVSDGAGASCSCGASSRSSPFFLLVNICIYTLVSTASPSIPYLLLPRQESI
jgi:hypothetical protein